MPVPISPCTSQVFGLHDFSCHRSCKAPFNFIQFNKFFGSSLALKSQRVNGAGQWRNVAKQNVTTEGLCRHRPIRSLRLQAKTLRCRGHRLRTPNIEGSDVNCAIYGSIRTFVALRSCPFTGNFFGFSRIPNCHSVGEVFTLTLIYDMIGFVRSKVALSRLENGSFCDLFRQKKHKTRRVGHFRMHLLHQNIVFFQKQWQQ